MNPIREHPRSGDTGSALKVLTLKFLCQMMGTLNFVFLSTIGRVHILHVHLGEAAM
jgi:hypothetical protein